MKGYCLTIDLGERAAALKRFVSFEKIKVFTKIFRSVA